jgi:phosphatidylglycerol---prolipoprotein diacylglyceryl transferase
MRPLIVDYLDDAVGTTIFDWIIPAPSVIYPIAFISVAIVFVKRCNLIGLDRQVTYLAILIGGVGAFIGAKLFFIAVHYQSYMLQPSHVFAPGGTISWGAYAGAFLAIGGYIRIRKKPLLSYLDILASSIALGPFIGRWSCFLNGDDYGVITNVPWSVQYPYGSIPHAAHLHSGIIGFDALYSAPVHPNQIYLAVNGLILFILLTWVWKKLRFYPGVTLGLFAILYGASRFILEFFRDDTASSIIPQLNSSQVYSLFTVGLGILVVWFVIKPLFAPAGIDERKHQPLHKGESL